MGKLSSFENMINEQLLSLNTAYIGKVLSYSNGKANIQPLNMIKEYGKSAKKQSPIPNVPVIESARFKAKEVEKKLTIEGEEIELKYLEPIPLAVGDIVICVCCDRDITETKNGNMAIPQIGHHSLSDSVVVGVL